MLTEQRIIEIRKATRGRGYAPWADSIAFARAVEAEARREALEAAARRAEAFDSECAKAIRALAGGKP